MRVGGGKAKGSEFERFVSKKLSLWITNGARDNCLWRSSMSGGRATLQLQEDIINRAQSGDLTAISPEAYIICDKTLFECKTYKDLQIAESIIKGTGNLLKFWTSTVIAARKFSKIPVLVAKQNRFPIILVCPSDCGLFVKNNPLIELPHWGKASIYLFEDAIGHIRANRVGRAVVDLPASQRNRITLSEDMNHRPPQATRRARL